MLNTRERLEPGIYRRNNHLEVHFQVKGKERTQTMPEGSSLRAARALRAKLQGKVQDGFAVAPGRMTVNDLLEAWITDHAATTQSQNTLAAYRLDAGYWSKTIGDLRLRKLTVQEIETARDALAGDEFNLAPKSIKNALGTLRVAFSWAIRHDLTGRNLAADVTPPHVERFVSHWADGDEARRLLAVFERRGAPYGTMLALALLTCLRVESEWGGMRWRDVDLNRKKASLVQVRLQDGSTIPAGNDKHKRRLIELSDEAVRFLETQRKWQARMRDANEGAWVDDVGFVFTTHHGERIRQSTLQRQFLRMQAEATVPRMRVHDLRHTAATLLLGAGVHVKIVSEMLGHSSVKMTLDTYGHAVPGLTEAAAKQLGELLSPGRLTKRLTSEAV